MGSVGKPKIGSSHFCDSMKSFFLVKTLLYIRLWKSKGDTHRRFGIEKSHNEKESLPGDMINS